MNLWYLSNPGRLGAERRSIDALASTEEWFRFERWAFHNGHLCVCGSIVAHGVDYPIRLIFPDQFPEVPAWVEPQHDVKWSNHQYGSGGPLCLELRPDNWRPEARGVDMLRSAYNLLHTENAPGERKQYVESAHEIGSAQSSDWGITPLRISRGCYARTLAGAASGLVALRLLGKDDILPIVVHDEEDRKSKRRPPPADLASLRFEIPVYVNAGVPPPALETRAEIVNLDGYPNQTISLHAEKGAALILFTGGAKLSAYHLLEDDKAYERKTFVLPENQGLRSGREATAESKKVAIVGAGSVGSKVAESLVRSGVMRLALIDGDVMLPGNLERHALDWREVGFRKVFGLRRQLLEIAPGAEILALKDALDWQRSSRKHAEQIDLIAEADVIVDATGDVPTALLLGAIAAANGKAFVTVEVLEGGIGALVASYVPGRDPSFATGRAAFLSWCEQQGVKPPEPGPSQYEAIGDDGVPIVADDAAATIAAANAARVILDILDGNAAPPESAWLLFGFRKGWIFQGHGETIRLTIDAPLQGPIVIDEDAKGFILELIRQEVSDESSSES